MISFVFCFSAIFVLFACGCSSKQPGSPPSDEANARQTVSAVIAQMPPSLAPETTNFEKDFYDLDSPAGKYSILVARRSDETPEDYGLRFFVFKNWPDNPTQFLGTTPGEKDSEILQPFFRTVGSRQFLLGIVGGCESPWGLSVYEILPDRIKSYGYIDAYPVTDNLAKKIAVTINPRGALEIILITPVNLWPGTDQEKLILSDQRSEVRFTFNGERFVF